ncbi:hypothetical protein BaRGS_00010423 [Batillaria attramentaria]|uniref:Uncharacterized protein n=1 Tax=Batillaria attramentaria TaxID=370345 RepID=A0ABD0LFZ0_9CAEN
MFNEYLISELSSDSPWPQRTLFNQTFWSGILRLKFLPIERNTDSFIQIQYCPDAENTVVAPGNRYGSVISKGDCIVRQSPCMTLLALRRALDSHDRTGCADDRLKETRDALVVVQHTGEVLWMPQAMLNSSCSFDTLYFPFDEQECKLKFGSWTYNGWKLDLNFIHGQESMDLTDFTPSNEWTIVANEGKKHIQRYNCCPEPYLDITFTLRMRRRVAFYSFILILPCGLLSLLTMVIFWVPPESPAKLQIGMNIFLAFFVLLLLLADYTPRAAASIPLIGAYFCLSMIMITLSTVLACVVANMFFRGCVIDGLARFLCMRSAFVEPRKDVTTPKKTWSTFVSTYRSFSDPETLCAKVHLLDVDNNFDSKTDLQDCGLEDLFGEASNAEEDDEVGAPELLSEVEYIRETLDMFQEQRDTDDAKMRHVREWRMISCVLDRLFFAIYMFINIMGLAAIVVRAFFPD